MKKPDRLLAEKLLQISAIKLQPESPFVWGTGWNSPIYIENPRLLSYPDIRNLIKIEMAKEIIEHFSDVDAIASVSTGAIPMGAIVADALGVPFLTYFFLRRTHVAAHGMTVFSALWMQGIVMFACASLIFGAIAFVYLRYVNPGFVAMVFEYLADFYRQTGDEGAGALADELQTVIDKNAYPRPAVIVIGEMWSVMFSGSLLSMVVGALARIKRVPVSGGM